MPIRARKNQFRGVNPHLHAALCPPGGRPGLWPAFHHHLLSSLLEIANTVLPERYLALIEPSLQAMPLPEIKPADLDIVRPAHPVAPDSGEQSATLSLSIEATLGPPPRVPALLIYEMPADELPLVKGKPILRVELISPSNVFGGERYAAYMDNRRAALQSGLPLLEIHLLHDARPPILNIPAYPQDADSHAYFLAYSDPRVAPDAGPVRVYGFGVDEPITALLLPLRAGVTITLDINLAYHRTFYMGRWGKWVDYALPPRHISSYGDEDQQRVIARMVRIAETLDAGGDLDG